MDWKKSIEGKTNYFFATIVLIVLVLGYFYGFFEYGYVVPFGDDPVRHVTNAIEFNDFGVALSKQGELDPPFIRILFSALSDLVGVEVYQVATYFMPLVVMLIIFSSYVVARKMFNNDTVALLSLFIFAFVTPQPGVIYNEGTYMNLLAALLIFPLFVVSFILLAKQKRRIFLLAPILLGVGVMGYHSLTSIYLFLFLALGALAILFTRNAATIKKYAIALFSIAILGSFIAYDFFVGRSLQFLLAKIGFVSEVSDEVIGGISQDPASVTANFDAFNHHLGFFVFLFGLLGMLFFTFAFKKDRLQKMLFIAWPVSLFLGSQIEVLPLSQRFARDTVYAFVILAAFFLVYYTKNLSKNMQRVSMGFVSLLLVASMVHFIHGQTNYNGLMRVKPIDLQVYEWVDKHIADEEVVLASSGVVNGGWGSYVTAITDNTFIDAGRCSEDEKNADGKCAFLYEPNSSIAKEFMRKENVSYIYSHRNIEPEHFLFSQIDYSYRSALEAAEYLEKVKTFTDPQLGSIIIYKVDKSRL